MNRDEIAEKIAKIKKEIQETPHHKGTEHHIGKLRARLAELEDKENIKRGRGKGGGFAVKRHGDATVVLVGFPSTGKSTLLNALTYAHSAIASYAFTTVTVIPGMLFYNGAQIQILDVPGLISGAAKGMGKGREVLSVARNADLLLLIIEAYQERQLKTIKEELSAAGVPLLPALTVITKADLLSGKERQNYPPEYILVSAKYNEGLEELKEIIWQKLELIRVYLQKANREPERENPLIVKKGSTVQTVAEKIFPDEGQNIISARLWGPSAKFPGQTVSLSHQLQDEDILSF